MPTLINIIGLYKKFTSLNNNIIDALSNVSFNIARGEFVSIIGPSGSGKSTLLNTISNLTNISKGKIEFFENKKPTIGYVFQDNSIFPWRTVIDNITFALEVKKTHTKTKNEIANMICTQIGLNPEIYLDKYPKELSGGEKRRIAIGMAIAYNPELLLLDEPTTQLDYINKWKIQNLIQDIWLEKKMTTLLVTHDIEESIYLGNRVVILENGIIKADIKIELPRPRKNDLRNNNLFIEYKQKIMEYFTKVDD